MVRETRHLCIGNIPENVREDQIRDLFQRHGRVQSVKLFGGAGGNGVRSKSATVAFIDIRSASKALRGIHSLSGHPLHITYHEPQQPARQTSPPITEALEETQSSHIKARFFPPPFDDHPSPRHPQPSPCQEPTQESRNSRSPNGVRRHKSRSVSESGSSEGGSSGERSRSGSRSSATASVSSGRSRSPASNHVRTTSNNTTKNNNNHAFDRRRREEGRRSSSSSGSSSPRRSHPRSPVDSFSPTSVVGSLGTLGSVGGVGTGPGTRRGKGELEDPRIKSSDSGPRRISECCGDPEGGSTPLRDELPDPSPDRKGPEGPLSLPLPEFARTSRALSVSGSCPLVSSSISSLPSTPPVLTAATATTSHHHHHSSHHHTNSNCTTPSIPSSSSSSSVIGLSLSTSAVSSFLITGVPGLNCGGGATTPSSSCVPSVSSEPSVADDDDSKSSDSGGLSPKFYEEGEILDKRIQQLYEKYDNWSVVRGTRSVSESLEGLSRFAPLARHRLLDLDELRAQPSDIFKTVASKKSIFDEDSKRLENFGEKYEAKVGNWRMNLTRSFSTSAAPSIINNSTSAAAMWAKAAMAQVCPPSPSDSFKAPPKTPDIQSPRVVSLTSREEMQRDGLSGGAQGGRVGMGIVRSGSLKMEVPWQKERQKSPEKKKGPPPRISPPRPVERSVSLDCVRKAENLLSQRRTSSDSQRNSPTKEKRKEEKIRKDPPPPPTPITNSVVDPLRPDSTTTTSIALPKDPTKPTPDSSSVFTGLKERLDREGVSNLRSPSVTTPTTTTNTGGTNVKDVSHLPSSSNLLILHKDRPDLSIHNTKSLKAEVPSLISPSISNSILTSGKEHHFVKDKAVHARHSTSDSTSSSKDKHDKLGDVQSLLQVKMEPVISTPPLKEREHVKEHVKDQHGKEKEHVKERHSSLSQKDNVTTTTFQHLKERQESFHKEKVELGKEVIGGKVHNNNNYNNTITIFNTSITTTTTSATTTTTIESGHKDKHDKEGKESKENSTHVHLQMKEKHDHGKEHKSYGDKLHHHDGEKHTKHGLHEKHDGPGLIGKDRHDSVSSGSSHKDSSHRHHGHHSKTKHVDEESGSVRKHEERKLQHSHSKHDGESEKVKSKHSSTSSETLDEKTKAKHVELFGEETTKAKKHSDHSDKPTWHTKEKHDKEKHEKHNESHNEEKKHKLSESHSEKHMEKHSEKQHSEKHSERSERSRSGSLKLETPTVNVHKDKHDHGHSKHEGVHSNKVKSSIELLQSKERSHNEKKREGSHGKDGKDRMKKSERKKKEERSDGIKQTPEISLPQKEKKERLEKVKRRLSSHDTDPGSESSKKARLDKSESENGDRKLSIERRDSREKKKAKHEKKSSESEKRHSSSHSRHSGKKDKKREESSARASPEKKKKKERIKSGEKGEKSEKKKKEPKKTKRIIDDSDTTDHSEEEKHHSIFEVVVDEYVSMYDKVKSRSNRACKKVPPPPSKDEKKTDKTPDIFASLKKSRAKREEKKRSTSIEESSKMFPSSSSSDEEMEIRSSSEGKKSEEPPTKKIRTDEQRILKEKKMKIYSSSSSSSDKESLSNKSKLSSKDQKTFLMKKKLFESSDSDVPQQQRKEKRKKKSSNSTTTSSSKPPKRPEPSKRESGSTLEALFGYMTPTDSSDEDEPQMPRPITPTIHRPLKAEGSMENREIGNREREITNRDREVQNREKEVQREIQNRDREIREKDVHNKDQREIPREIQTREQRDIQNRDREVQNRDRENRDRENRDRENRDRENRDREVQREIQNRELKKSSKMTPEGSPTRQLPSATPSSSSWREGEKKAKKKREKVRESRESRESRRGTDREESREGKEKKKRHREKRKEPKKVDVSGLFHSPPRDTPEESMEMEKEIEPMDRFSDIKRELKILPPVVKREMEVEDELRRLFSSEEDEPADELKKRISDVICASAEDDVDVLLQQKEEDEKEKLMILENQAAAAEEQKKEQEKAIESIVLLSSPQPPSPPPPTTAVPPVIEKSEMGEETIISQEETEDAVAALLETLGDETPRPSQGTHPASPPTISIIEESQTVVDPSWYDDTKSPKDLEIDEAAMEPPPPTPSPPPVIIKEFKQEGTEDVYVFHDSPEKLAPRLASPPTNNVPVPIAVVPPVISPKLPISTILPIVVTSSTTIPSATGIVREAVLTPVVTAPPPPVQISVALDMKPMVQPALIIFKKELSPPKEKTPPLGSSIPIPNLPSVVQSSLPPPVLPPPVRTTVDDTIEDVVRNVIPKIETPPPAIISHLPPIQPMTHLPPQLPISHLAPQQPISHLPPLPTSKASHSPIIAAHSQPLLIQHPQPSLIQHPQPSLIQHSLNSNVTLPSQLVIQSVGQPERNLERPHERIPIAIHDHAVHPIPLVQPSKQSPLRARSRSREEEMSLVGSNHNSESENESLIDPKTGLLVPRVAAEAGEEEWEEPIPHISLPQMTLQTRTAEIVREERAISPKKQEGLPAILHQNTQLLALHKPIHAYSQGELPASFIVAKPQNTQTSYVVAKSLSRPVITATQGNQTNLPFRPVGGLVGPRRPILIQPPHAGHLVRIPQVPAATTITKVSGGGEERLIPHPSHVVVSGPRIHPDQFRRKEELQQRWPEAYPPPPRIEVGGSVVVGAAPSPKAGRVPQQHEQTQPVASQPQRLVHTLAYDQPLESSCPLDLATPTGQGFPTNSSPPFHQHGLQQADVRVQQHLRGLEYGGVPQYAPHFSSRFQTMEEKLDHRGAESPLVVQAPFQAQRLYQHPVLARQTFSNPYAELEDRPFNTHSPAPFHSPGFHYDPPRSPFSPALVRRRPASPPPAHHARYTLPAAEAPASRVEESRQIQVQTPPHASPVPPQGDSLLTLLQRYPIMWQGLLALKNDNAACQMHFVSGNMSVARESLPAQPDGSVLPLRISQRMRLEQTQLEGVARKMQMEAEHCMLLALPCGRDHMDVLQQSNNLRNGFITYLQLKQAAGIVNICHGHTQMVRETLEGSFEILRGDNPAYVIHIFPSCDFANENLARIAPDLLHGVADIAHLLIVIATST